MKPETPSAWLIAPVLPVVVVEDEDAALFIAGAFLEAGLRQIEITLRSRASMKALEAVARRFPAMKVAAGTVLEPPQIAAARDAGATLCVSPGFTPMLAEAMTAQAMPWVPGTATAGEVMRACEAGFSLLKFFPAMAAGGPAGPAGHRERAAAGPERRPRLHPHRRRHAGEHGRLEVARLRRGGRRNLAGPGLAGGQPRACSHRGRHP